MFAPFQLHKIELFICCVSFSRWNRYNFSNCSFLSVVLFFALSLRYFARNILYYFPPFSAFLRRFAQFLNDLEAFPLFCKLFKPFPLGFFKNSLLRSINGQNFAHKHYITKFTKLQLFF